MHERSNRWMNSLVTLAFALFVWAVAPGIASADRVTNANEPIVISDDITNYTQEVSSAPGVTPAGIDNSRSGLGDDTNAGLGDGTDNSPNQGTLNPNRAPDRTGPGH